MPVQFSESARKKLDAVIARYPNRMAATLPALHIAQADLGALTPEVQQVVADYLHLPVAHVYGVVTFYTMFHQKPVGKMSSWCARTCRACCGARTTSWRI